jgi:hypothetical protein
VPLVVIQDSRLWLYGNARAAIWMFQYSTLRLRALNGVMNSTLLRFNRRKESLICDTPAARGLRCDISYCTALLTAYESMAIQVCIYLMPWKLRINQKHADI